MDSLSKLFSDLASWYWWATVVFVGLAINLASAYLKPSIDRLFGRFSAGRRAKNEARRRELDRKAEELASEPTLLLVEGLAEMRELLFGLVLLVLSLALAGFGITFLTSLKVVISDKTVLTLSVAPIFIFVFASHVLFLYLVNRAISRAVAISLSTRKLVKVDDGAGAHLEGASLPDLALPSTDGAAVNLAALSGRWVIYIYPLTGRPDIPLPDGWDAVPGARGCTPQSCSFRDHYAELKSLNTSVFGLSAQTTEYQREARDRLHLPFHLLSDSSLRLKDALRLPTFTVAGMELFKRLTLIAESGRIKKAFYPVFPPDRNAEDVLAWLRKDAPPGGAGDAS